MGWRGTLRTLGAIAREAERNSQRRQREHQRYLLAVEKSRKQQDAAQAVRDHETHLTNLVSIHKSGTAPIDWPARASAVAPILPAPVHAREQGAQKRLSSYSASWFTELLGLTAYRVRTLEAAVIAAKNNDEKENKENLAQYEHDLADYREEKQLAERLLADDGEALLQVIKEMNPFREIRELGSNVVFRPLGHHCVAADLEVHGEAVVPKETLTLLQSGRASVKKKPKGEYYLLYQDYVCSALLRVARELFAILPIDGAVVTAKEQLLNTQTGHLEVMPILSVFIPLDSFRKINLDRLDPSDAMKNFIHEMDFRPTTGFHPVQVVALPPT
jgi:hypothetical protein